LPPAPLLPCKYKLSNLKFQISKSSPRLPLPAFAVWRLNSPVARYSLRRRKVTSLTADIAASNAAFYRALETGLIELMDDVWAHEDWVRCVHPGWDLITGWHRVRESWKSIFDGGQRMKVMASEVVIEHQGDFAWVTCTENVTVFSGSNFDSAQAIATNLFVRRDDGWRMVHHHASPIPMIVSDNASEIIQ
jgi:ketosteroid isomerase-like protein